jgi:hypothetical protein
LRLLQAGLVDDGVLFRMPFVASVVGCSYAYEPLKRLRGHCGLAGLVRVMYVSLYPYIIVIFISIRSCL